MRLVDGSGGAGRGYCDGSVDNLGMTDDLDAEWH